MAQAKRHNTDEKYTLDILVQRQLDIISSGNGAYLETFLTNVKRADFHTRVVFAPEWSFGNRPWASVHPRMKQWIDEIEWPGSLRIGETFWSLSPRVWGRFAVRVVKELLIRCGAEIKIDSYLGRPVRASEARRIAKICNASDRNITIAEYSSLAPVLKLITTETQKGVLMHDLLSDRGPRFRANGQEPDFFEVSRETEADWCADATLMIYASANELETFTPEIKGSKSVWLRPEPPEYGATPDNLPAHVVFIGTTHAGNHDALDHFVDDIWPLILKERPEAQFKVVGSVGKHLTSARANTKGVKILGRVEHLEECGGSGAIGIAPTRLATGVSIKVVEYLMLDMTCVAYPLALEGFGPALDDLVYSEETPLAFAQKVLALMTDDEERRRVASRSQAEARRILSNDDLVEFLKEAVKPTNNCATLISNNTDENYHS